MNNVTLLAVPLFIFMGTILEKSGIAKMLKTWRHLNTKGGLSINNFCWSIAMPVLLLVLQL